VHEPPTLLFSIVIACLNAEAHIDAALESVLSQDHPSFEVVVVDGGSTDRTLDVVRSHEVTAGGRLSWTSQPDEGIYDAMNDGLSRVGGLYVAFLGADDRLVPGALAAVDDALRSNGFPEIVCGTTRVVGAVRPWLQPPRSFRTASRIPKRPPSTHQSVFVSRQALVEVGGFDTRYRIAADYDVYVRLVQAGARELLIDDALSEFRLGGASSRNTWATAREYRDVRIAHGANPIWQQFVLLKAVLAATLSARLRGTREVR